MPEHQSETEHSTFTVHNALLAPFKHKWLVIICTLIGLIAAAGVWFFYPAVYTSQAKLLVRYVLDRSAVDPVEATNTASQRTVANVITSEVEILTSWDLATQVAEALGPKRLLPEKGNN